MESQYYEKELNMQDDFRILEGVKQIQLDGIWYDLPSRGEAQMRVIVDSNTFQPVMLIGPWRVPMEAARQSKVALVND